MRNGDVLHSRYRVSLEQCLLFSLVYCLVFCFEYPEDPFSVCWKIMSSASSSSSSVPSSCSWLLVLLCCRDDRGHESGWRFESATHKIAFHASSSRLVP